MILKQIGPYNCDVSRSGIWSLEELSSTSVPEVLVKCNKPGVLMPNSVWHVAVHTLLHWIFERHGSKAMIRHLECSDDGLITGVEFVDFR